MQSEVKEVPRGGERVGQEEQASMDKDTKRVIQSVLLYLLSGTLSNHLAHVYCNHFRNFNYFSVN